MATEHTELIKIHKPLTDDQLFFAANVLRNGGLVAFPTETVYGLGANAYDEAAVAAIFEAKGRPSDNPLIVHVPSPDKIEALTTGSLDQAKMLMSAYSPGPLTVVLRRSKLVPDIVTAGLDTVAIRIPAHDTALRLLKLTDVPVAAPSANRSGRPSPTRAAHVYEDLAGLIPCIIDDGACSYGLESTVLDLTGKKPVILRPGAITADQIEAVIGIRPILAVGLTDDEQTPRAPGMKYRHYAPNANVLIAYGDKSEDRARQINKLVAECLHEATQAQISGNIRIGLFSSRKTREMIRLDNITSVNFAASTDVKDLNYSDKLEIIFFDYASEPRADAAASELFLALREFDEIDVDMIIAEALPEEGMGLAYMNRLTKAAGGGEAPKLRAGGNK